MPRRGGRPTRPSSAALPPASGPRRRSRRRRSGGWKARRRPGSGRRRPPRARPGSRPARRSHQVAPWNRSQWGGFPRDRLGRGQGRVAAGEAIREDLVMTVPRAQSGTSRAAPHPDPETSGRGAPPRCSPRRDQVDRPAPRSPAGRRCRRGGGGRPAAPPPRTRSAQCGPSAPWRATRPVVEHQVGLGEAGLGRRRKRTLPSGRGRSRPGRRVVVQVGRVQAGVLAVVAGVGEERAGPWRAGWYRPARARPGVARPRRGRCRHSARPRLPVGSSGPSFRGPVGAPAGAGLLRCRPAQAWRSRCPRRSTTPSTGHMRYPSAHAEPQAGRTFTIGAKL